MIWATAGGVTIGLGILAWYLISWFPGKKPLLSDPLTHVARLLPFVFGSAYGTLGILTVGGLIGWIFDTTLWIANWLGDVALMIGVGASAGVSAQGRYLPLTSLGSLAVFLLTVIVVAIIKKRPSGDDVKKGVLCGACLGTSAGIAGLAAVPLAQAANWLGGVVYGAIA